MQPNLLVRCPLRPSSVASRQTQLQSQNLAQHFLPQPQIGFSAHTNTVRNTLLQQQGPMARQQPLADTFADIFCSPNLQSDALRRPSPQHNRPVGHTTAKMSNVQSLSIQIMHLRRAIRNVDNAIAAQHATSPGKDPMLKIRALGLLLSKKDTLLRLLNGAITAMHAQSGAGPEQQQRQLQQQHLHEQSQQLQPPSSQPPFNPLLVERNALRVGISPLAQVHHSLANPILTQRGFFSHAGQIQMRGCEISEIHGDKIINPQYYFESRTTAFAWAQLLVSMPPSALIVGHGGYLYLNKLHHRLDGDAKPTTTQAGPTNALMTFINNQQIRDLTGLIKLLLFYFVIFRKFIVRH